MTRLLVAPVLLFILGLSSAVRADSPAPPRTYTVETEDGRYVFVMLTSLPPDFENRFFTEGFVEEMQETRRRYRQSGLYRTDDPTTPLWTVDWYAHSVLVFSDGVHLVRPGPWASSAQNEGVSFFANGELLETYTIEDLVAAPWAMPRSVSHFTWRDETSIDDAALTYHIRTLHGEEIDFDVRTGKIIRSFLPSLFMLGALMIGGIVYLGARRYRRTKKLITGAGAD